MFGITTEGMKAAFEDALELNGPKMLVMSQLSDAQEEIALGLHEQARQTINRAKWIVSQYLNEPRA